MRNRLRGAAQPSGARSRVSLWRGCLVAAYQHPSAKQAPQDELLFWKQLGKWSGRGNTQTEIVLGLTGALRMHWQTKNESPQGTGTFLMVLRSAISGRELQNPVDERGVGEGTAYVTGSPHFLRDDQIGKPRLVVHL